jgi:hypothetical protein
MGLCFSDVRGGKQAIGGTSQQNPNSNNNAAHNDAVDFFFKSNGQQALFTQVEVYVTFCVNKKRKKNNVRLGVYVYVLLIYYIS